MPPSWIIATDRGGSGVFFLSFFFRKALEFGAQCILRRAAFNLLLETGTAGPMRGFWP